MDLMRVFASLLGNVIVLMARAEGHDRELGDASWTLKQGASFYGLSFDEIASKVPCTIDVSVKGVASVV